MITASRSFKNKVSLSLRYFLMTSIALIVLLPFLWMISTALKPLEQVFIFPPKWIPNPIMWNNFRDVLTSFPFFLYLKNTSIITLLSIFGHLLSCSLVAFGFSRINFPGRDILFLLMISTMIIPWEALMISQYILFKLLGWVDTFAPLVVPRFFGNAFLIFLLRQFFLTIPIELDEATKIDGGGYLTIYSKVVLPLVKPALIMVSIFSFTWYWNDFMGPLIYLNSSEKITLSLGLRLLTGHLVVTGWNLMMAASLMVTIPCVILFIVAQKYFIESIVLTGLKG